MAAISVGSLGSAWRLGLATDLANPKAVAFFGALFASLLPAGLSTAARAEVVLALLFMALTWLVAVAWTASTGRVAAAYQRGRRAIDAVTGGVLAGVGLALFPR
ncbi:LysE family transporter [Nostocoides vanveenii]|uniref:LysE family transporter n=1 Tax=Nostocoides vanveenii TaxID=330835 RepID=UPI0031CF84C8